MNYLSIVKKHMELAEVAYGNIVKPETREKAIGIIHESFARMGIPERYIAVTVGAVSSGEAAPSVIVAIPEAVVGVSEGGATQTLAEVPKPVESAKTPEMYKGNPVCEPVTDYEVTDKPVANVPPEAPPVEMRDGFPVKAKVIVGSRCINPKLLAGRLEDGRQVSIERGFRNWKVGDVAECELARSGGSPLYRQVGTRT